MLHGKKSEITLKFLIELALYAIVLILFVIPMSMKLYNLLAGRAKPATIDSMEALIKEIKYLEEEDVIPLFVDDKHMLVGFDIDDSSKPGSCKKDLSCLCTCKIAGCNTNRGVEKCIVVEYELGDKKIHLDNILINPNQHITNYHVVLAGDTVTVTERPGIGT